MNRLAVLGSVTVALALVSSGAVGAIHTTQTIELAASNAQLVDDDGTVRVEVAGALYLQAPGTPALPTSIRWTEIPAGYRVTGVEVVSVETRSLGSHFIAAQQPDRRLVDAADIHPLLPLAGTWPRQWAEVSTQGSMRGHRLAALAIHPLRWNAETQELIEATRLELRLTLETDPSAVPLARHRVVERIEKSFEEAVGGIIADFQPQSRQGGSVAGPGPYQPTFRPTTDGSPVEYVIITNEELEPEFQRLADFKTRKGVQATVRTIEWIDQTYPNGTDRAERIRFFLQDAYQNWGTLYALLGGDTDVVPPRYATTTSPLPENIPADMYFGCLEDNWNGDGDELWGEGQTSQSSGDQCDLLFEVSIGRAPTSTLADAQTFVDKILLYEIDAPSSFHYPASMLAMAERLFPASHGADKAEDAIAFLPPWWKVVRLYEESGSYPGSIELTAEAAIDSINNGFGFVLHVGHGFRNTMSVGSGTLNNPDIDALINAPRNSTVFAINCSSASIDFNSIGERWVKNPNGGSISYIGTSRLAYVTASTVYTNQWFETMFDSLSTTSLGLVTDMARAILVPGSVFDGATRWNLTATTLLGDPETDLYLNEIIAMDASHPSTVFVGQSTVNVTVTSNGAPVEDATVTLLKAGESYTIGTTNASGMVTLDFFPRTAGIAQITAHKSTYRIYESTVAVVASAGGFAYINGSTIDDDNSGASNGDGDGLADAGETLELTLTLRNGGGSSVTGVTATLSAIQDPAGALTITSPVVSYGTISGGGSSGGSSRYVVGIDANSPDGYQPVLELDIQADQGSWTDTIVLPIRRPYLEHYDHVIVAGGDNVVEPGESVTYTIEVRNSGQDGLDLVTATLQALRASDGQPNPDVTVTDGNSSFGSVAAGAIETGDPFAFNVSGGADVSDIQLRVTFSNAPFFDLVQDLDVINPGVPDSARAFGSPTTITLKWKRPQDTDVLGYDVFRSSSPFGPWDTQVNEYIIEGTAVFEDHGLPPLTGFFYRIVTRDQSYNRSPLSNVVIATTNPPQKTGWPIEMGQQSSVSPTIVDLDGDWEMEILCAAEMQYAWHGDATEVVDGDDDPRTSGPYSLWGKNLDKGFGATQAVGDMDNDGLLEVANVGWTADSLFVWDHIGNLKPGWPKSVLDDFNWASPVMVDLDLDGDLEVIVWAGGGGRLFAWHHDGTEFFDGDANPATDGILYRVFGTSFNYGTPAVGNLDADPEPEIVMSNNKTPGNTGEVYAINGNGVPVPGWPFVTGSGAASEISSAPAIGDVDKNGDLEVVISCERQSGRLYMLNHDATVFPGWPVVAGAVTADARIPSPVLADVNEDTFLDIVYAATDGRLFLFNRNGAPLGPAIEYSEDTSNSTQCTPSIADVDGDNLVEVIFGDEKGRVHAYNRDGSIVQGFPIQTSGEVRATPAVWDLDQDSLAELVVNSFDGNVYVWDLPTQFVPTFATWPTFGHDTRNTNLVETNIQPVAVSDPGPDASPTLTVPALYPAVPNPFNPRTELRFDIPGEAGAFRRVELAIYDVNGRRIRYLIDSQIQTGTHAMVWEGRVDSGGAAPSGVYFAELRVDGNFSTRQKLVMLR